MNFEEFKKKLLDKYDLLFKNGYDLEYPTESEIIMLFMSRIVFTEFEIKEMKKLNYKINWDKWREEVELKGAWRVGDSPEKPSNAEIKRLMLVLRQETIKLDRMLKY